MPCDSTQTHERLDICGGSAGTVMWSGSESPLIVVHLELTAVAMSRVRRDGCSAPLRRSSVDEHKIRQKREQSCSLHGGRGSLAVRVRLKRFARSSESA